MIVVWREINGNHVEPREVEVIMRLETASSQTTDFVFLVLRQLILCFQDQLKDSIHGSNTRMICFDYHQNCRGGRLEKLSVLKEKAQPSLKEFGLFFAKGDQIIRYTAYLQLCISETRKKVFRTFSGSNSLRT